MKQSSQPLVFLLYEACPYSYLTTSPCIIVFFRMHQLSWNRLSIQYELYDRWLRPKAAVHPLCCCQQILFNLLSQWLSLTRTAYRCQGLILCLGELGNIELVLQICNHVIRVWKLPPDFDAGLSNSQTYCQYWILSSCGFFSADICTV